MISYVVRVIAYVHKKSEQDTSDQVSCCVLLYHGERGQDVANSKKGKMQGSRRSRTGVCGAARSRDKAVAAASCAPSTQLVGRM